jgi:outer membrane lipoprotein carrier protein
MLLLLGLLAASGKPPPAAHEGVLDRISERYQDVPTLEASFVQTSRSPLYGEETQKGTLALERPNKVRWVFEGDGRHFITDGATLWIWSPNDKQVLRFKQAGPELTAALQVLQSLHRVRELFLVTVVSSDAQRTVLSLAPKPGDPIYFETLVLTLDGALSLEQVEITDPQGTQTTLAFSNVALGKDLPDALFTFVVPAGVDVIDATP